MLAYFHNRSFIIIMANMKERGVSDFGQGLKT